MECTDEALPTLLIGVDYHPSFQQIVFLVEETGEYRERRLNHSDGKAERFYRDLKLQGNHLLDGVAPFVIPQVYGLGVFGV